MASNPLNAFLQGMQAVNTLETNRTRRDYFKQQQAFQREEMSRTRKMWKRADDDYELQKLNTYRQEKLVELDLVVKDVIAGLPAGSAMLNDRRAIFNEALKRMQANDSSFGEHVALALGEDPAAGASVDKQNPVHGFGITGEGTVFWELNTALGHQPMTENRSSAGNDPVMFRGFGGQELVKIFGPGVMGNDLLVAEQLRNALGLDQVTGNPLETQDRPQQRQQRAAAPEPEAVAPEAVAPEFVDDPQAVPPGPAESDLHPNAAFAEEYGAVQAANTVPPPRPTSEGRSDRVTPGEDTVANLGEESATNLASTINEALPPTPEENNQRFFEIIGIDPTTPRMTKPASKPADVQGSRKTYTPAVVAKDPEAAIAQAPAPESEAVAKATAGSVLAAEGARPSLAQVYNAVGLAKLKVISPEQLQYYARTGKLDPPAKRNLQIIQSEGMARIFDKDTGALSAPFSVGGGGGGTEGATLKSQQAMLNYLQDRTKGMFEDRPDLQSEFISATEGAFTILGFPSNSEAGINARANPDVLNSLVRAAGFTHRYDHDTAQNLLQGTGDFNPLPGSDYKIAPNNPGAIAVAYVADQTGITSQKAADEFLTQYAGKYAAANRDMSPRELVLNVAQYENVVKARMRAGSDPEHADHEKYKGKSRDKIRRELVEELIDSR